MSSARVVRSKRVWVSVLLAVPLAGLVVLARGESEPARRPSHPGERVTPAVSQRETASNPGVLFSKCSLGDASSKVSGARPLLGSSESLPTPRTGGPTLDPRASGAEILTALRASSGEEAREVELALLEEPTIPGDAAFVSGLVSLAKDATAPAGTRVVALDLIPRAASTAEPAIAAIRELAIARGEDPEVRTAALLSLRLLALERPELERPVRAALLDALEQAPTSEARASGLDGLGLAQAEDADVTRVLAWLGDADAFVRAGAAHALGSVSTRAAAGVTSALEKALAGESDEGAAAAIRAALGRPVADDGTTLAAGEKDPVAR